MDEDRGLVGLKTLNALAFALHITSGVLGVVLYPSNLRAPVIVPLVDFGGSPGGAPFTPKPKVLLHVPVFLSGILFEFITAAAHLVYLALRFAGPAARARVNVLFAGRSDVRSVNVLRFYEYSITSTIMNVGGLIAIGITDAFYLGISTAIGLMLQVVGYMLEISDPRDPAQKRLMSIVLNQWTILTLVQLSSLLWQVFASATHHLDIMAWNILPNAILWQSFGVVARMDWNRVGPFSDPYFTERAYMALSLITKLSLFWLQTSTTRQLLEDNGVLPRSPVNWDAVRMTSGYGLSGLLILYGAGEWLYWRRLSMRAVMPDILDVLPFRISGEKYKPHSRAPARVFKIMRL